MLPQSRRQPDTQVGRRTDPRRRRAPDTQVGTRSAARYGRGEGPAAAGSGRGAGGDGAQGCAGGGACRSLAGFTGKMRRGRCCPGQSSGCGPAGPGLERRAARRGHPAAARREAVSWYGGRGGLQDRRPSRGAPARGRRIWGLQPEVTRPEPAEPETRRGESGPGRRARCRSGKPLAGITRRRRGVSLHRGAASRFFDGRRPSRGACRGPENPTAHVAC
jgi:hypothetical protein